MKHIALASIVIMCLCGLATGAAAQEKRLTQSHVPKAVLSAFARAYPGATVRGYASEKQKGARAYEVESVEGAIHRDILFAADGTVLEIEESIPVAALPDVVRAAVATKYPHGTITQAEKITENGSTGYELVVRHGKRRSELRLDAAGTIVEQE